MALMGRSPAAWRLRRYAGDGLTALATWYAAVLLRIYVPLPLTEHLLPADRLPLAHPVALLVLVLQLLLLYFFGLYESREPRPRLQLAIRLLGLILLQGLVLSGYFFLTEGVFPRSVLLLYLGLDYSVLVGWRLLAQRLYRPRQRRVVLVGDGPAAAELARAIETHHWHGLEVVGFLRAAEPPRGASAPSPARDRASLPVPCLGELEDLPALLARGCFDDVILTPDADSWQTRLLGRLSAAGGDRVDVLLLPGPYESMIGRMRYRWVSDIPLIEVMRASEWRLYRPQKRFFDLILGSALLLVCLPAMTLCALAVRLSSPGPVLYRQVRVGRGQRPFTLLKFRTMRVDAEGDEELLATAGDPRLTPIGALLRQLRLDELPQLFNVLAGRMSLVGPRPERPGFVGRYLQEVPGYAERFALAPGLTGLAQVNGEYHSSPQNKLRYDLAYLANWSLWLDLSILVRTVRTVLSSRGV
jgi:exopolysaccharide biosynthesis polyprenyl glycosylphosphotransferase